jgi:hypothetical protein
VKYICICKCLCKNVPRYLCYIFRQQGIYCRFKMCCIITVLSSTKCCLFNNFILFVQKILMFFLTVHSNLNTNVVGYRLLYYYRDIISSDSSQHSLLRPFFVMAGTTVLATLPACCNMGPNSKHCS